VNENTRRQMLLIWDNNDITLPILHGIRNHVRYREIVNYLCNNRLFGDRLMEYFLYQKNSTLNLIADILRRVDNSLVKSKIHAKDLFSGRK